MNKQQVRTMSEMMVIDMFDEYPDMPAVINSKSVVNAWLRAKGLQAINLKEFKV
jgi:hypothetical protein